MSEIRFVVPAVPVAQPRQRHAIIAGHVRNFTPSDHPVQAFKATVRMAASAAYDGPPLEGALSMFALFVMPRPKAKTKKRGGNPRYHHTGRPDVDNLMKSLADSLKGLCWNDDSQIAMSDIRKCVAAADEQPHVTVLINTLTGY